VCRRIVFAAACVAGCGRFDFDSNPRGDASHGDADTRAPDGDLIPLDARPCGGTTHTITDNFDDNARNTTLWGNAYSDMLTTYAESGGRVVITLGASSPDDWAGYVTTQSYQLADDRVYVEVPQITTGASTNTVLGLFTSVAITDGPSIESEVNTLQFRRRIGGQIFDRGSVPYSPTEQRWWQIRERGGTTYWETSHDGVTWTVGHQEATAETAVFITLSAGTNTVTASPGTAIFDNFNGGAAPPSCP
jgi:hypothetical protein